MQSLVGPSLLAREAAASASSEQVGYEAEFRQCSVSEGFLVAAEVVHEDPVPTPSTPWQPGEYVAFAAAMAHQVAQRLSSREALVDGAVARAAS